MIASFLSLGILILGVGSFSRSAYLMGRDGLDNESTRGYMFFMLSGLLVIASAMTVNKALD